MSHINNDKIWLIIDNYFKTINKNLVSHQLDSFNIFIMKQIPKTIRQFNPIHIIKTDDNNNEYTIKLIIGGSIKEINKKQEILNDGEGIYITKPVLYENNLEKDTDIKKDNNIIYKNKIRQLYPNEARLKNLTYGVNILVNIFISYSINNKETFYGYDNDNKWSEINNKIKLKKLNLGFIPIMLGSKLCI